MSVETNHWVGTQNDFVLNLQLLFIAFKLAGIINWSWWLVLLPLWGGLVIFFIALLTIVGASKL